MLVGRWLGDAQTRELSRPWGEFGGSCHQEIGVGGQGRVITPPVWTLGPRVACRVTPPLQCLLIGETSPQLQSVPSVLSHLGCNRKPENFWFSMVLILIWALSLIDVT